MTSVLDAVSPTRWGQTLAGAPVLDTRVSAMVPALVRRWQDIPPAIDQAGLDQHFVSIHLGGAKRLSRRGEGGLQRQEVAAGAYSVVPAGSAFQWDTQGPVDFVHIYFEPRFFEQIVTHTFDRNPAKIDLRETLGHDDILVRALTAALLEELGSDGTQRAYLDDVMHLLLCRVFRLHSDVGVGGARARHVLAPYRLRRAVEFVEANLGASIGVAEIADASGISRFHFSRAFRQTTGKAPYAYLLERRVAAAKSLLIHESSPLTVIARQCGFTSLSQFSRMFKRETGTNPSHYRAAQ